MRPRFQYLPVLLLLLLGSCPAPAAETVRRPNILWITAEDISPNLGCYGDDYARTPQLDDFARESVRYARAFASAPVCSPARSCLITGMYATSLGTQRLRSQFPVPPDVRGFPALLREAGYYTANNVKTDYNLKDEREFIRDCWDDCSARAHWRGRKPGQPFFAVFNIMTTHQSRASVWPYAQFEREVASKLAADERHDPARATLPPYYPDTAEARRTWARYHDCLTAMDKEVGALLRQLAEDGLEGETIVFFYGDNGMGLPRGKRCLWDTGLHEPLLVRFPEKFKKFAPANPGGTTDRLVSFVDFAPTVLSLCGIRVPAHMQGFAFLGEAAHLGRQFVYGARDRVDEVFDLSRSVRDQRFLYIRNFMPHLSWMPPEHFSDGSTFRREFRQFAAEGKLKAAQLTYAGPRKPLEELYDTHTDPHQIHNLATNPAHRATLEKMRRALRDWQMDTRDLGFLTEPQVWDRIGESGTPFQMGQNENLYPLGRLLDTATLVGRDAIGEQRSLLGDSHDGVRYWAAVGLHAAGTNAAPAREKLIGALRDPSAVVRVEAASALVDLGEPAGAFQVLEAELKSPQPETALHAARALELLGERAKPAWAAMRQILQQLQRDPSKGDAAMFLRFSLESALASDTLSGGAVSPKPTGNQSGGAVSPKPTGNQSGGAVSPKPPVHVLNPVHQQSVRLEAFWAQQVKRLTEKWLPHCIVQMEKGGRGQELLNLIAAGKVLRGETPDWKYTGAPWSDAYIYNTVEAICLALEIDPGNDADLARAQASLRSKLEEWIPIILAAQGADGYIHSFHVLNARPHYSNVDWHEFYVMGYFIEMGVAHYRMTQGKDRRLYDAALRCADHLCATFGPPPKRTWRNGHPGLEYALCRLGRLVDEVAGAGKAGKYVELARYFLDHQHEGAKPTEYNQSDLPPTSMSEAKGHAVRATYFYTAMADIALLQGDTAFGHAVDRIWTNAIQKKHYITGGVGASHNGEAFAGNYELPNNGYCESCAGCGLSFWADRMHRLHRDAHYQDVLERVLYNNLLGSIELTGENFYYQNPLQSEVRRYPWHACPCCVGNIPRALLALKDLAYSVDRASAELFVNHYLDFEATISNIGGTTLRVRQKTRYPWQGRVTLTLHPESPSTFTLKLRIPNRTETELYRAEPDLAGRFELSVNGRRQSMGSEHGYVAVRRKWQDGDRVELSLPMEVQRVHCDSRVLANRGRVALQRGPIVYNVEDVDHLEPVAALVLRPELALTPAWKPDLLGGVMVIEGPGINAIPNFVRLNRGGASQLWITEDPEEVARNVPKPPSDLPGFDAIKARTIDVVAIGDHSSEGRHSLKSERSGHGRAYGFAWRHATEGGWMSYRMQVDPQASQAVFCTYWGGDSGNRRFQILVDGHEVGRQVLESNKPGAFFGVEYPILEEVTRGKRQVTVRIVADPGATAGGIFDLRILRREGGASR